MSRSLAFIGLFILGLSAVAATVATTDDEVKRMREEARQLRREADEIVDRARIECQKRFLVNACIDEAHEKRLEMLQKARQLEIQARQLEIERKKAEKEARERARAEKQGTAEGTQPATEKEAAPNAPPAASETPASAP
jgi:colicin import membrane protein